MYILLQFLKYELKRTGECILLQFFKEQLKRSRWLPQWLGSKDFSYSAGDAGDMGSVPGSEDPLEEGMATHSSILAEKIPWTEEPGGLYSS